MKLFGMDFDRNCYFLDLYCFFIPEKRNNSLKKQSIGESIRKFRNTCPDVILFL